MYTYKKVPLATPMEFQTYLGVTTVISNYLLGKQIHLEINKKKKGSELLSRVRRRHMFLIDRHKDKGTCLVG